MTDCPNGDPECIPEEWDTMCDVCKEDNARDYYEGMMDTYD